MGLKSDIQDKGIREYLLGRFTPEDGERLEERLMTDGEIYQELLVAEDELVDQYVAGQLSDSDTQSFETYFLATPERQQKLRFARSLKKYIKLTAEGDWIATASDSEAASNTSVISPAPARKGLSWWPPRPILSYSLAAAAVLVLLFVGVSVIRNLNRPAQGPGKVLAVELVPGVTRSDGGIRQITITPDTATVQLQLRIPNDLSYETYRGVLQTIGGDEITRLNDLHRDPSANGGVIYPVPASLLIPADYQLKLSGLNQQREFEDMARYTFRVRRN